LTERTCSPTFKAEINAIAFIDTLPTIKMNKTLVTIFLAFTSSFCFGQYNHDFRVGARNPGLDKLHNSFEKIVISEEIDSLFQNRNTLIDGEKIIYWDSLKPLPIFALKHKMETLMALFTATT